MFRVTVKTADTEIIVEAESDQIEKRHNIIMEIAMLRSRIVGDATLQDLSDCLLALRKK